MSQSCPLSRRKHFEIQIGLMMSEDVRARGVDRLLLFVLLISMASNGLLVYKLHSRSSNAAHSSKQVALLTSAEMTDIGAYDAPSRGRKDAPVTVVVFSDFQCIYCRQLAATLHEVELKTEDARIVMREMPLSMHPFARKDAELAACVKTQSEPAFWALYNFFFDPSSEIGSDLSGKGMEFIISRADINAAALRQCVSGHGGATQVDRDIALAKKFGVDGTPTVYVNGVLLTGQMRTPDALLKFIHEKAGTQALTASKEAKS